MEVVGGCTSFSSISLTSPEIGVSGLGPGAVSLDRASSVGGEGG